MTIQLVKCRIKTTKNPVNIAPFCTPSTHLAAKLSLHCSCTFFILKYMLYVPSFGTEPLYRSHAKGKLNKSKGLLILCKAKRGCSEWKKAKWVSTFVTVWLFCCYSINVSHQSHSNCLIFKFIRKYIFLGSYLWEAKRNKTRYTCNGR